MHPHPLLKAIWNPERNPSAELSRAEEESNATDLPRDRRIRRHSHGPLPQTIFHPPLRPLGFQSSYLHLGLFQRSPEPEIPSFISSRHPLPGSHALGREGEGKTGDVQGALLVDFEVGVLPETDLVLQAVDCLRLPEKKMREDGRREGFQISESRSSRTQHSS